MTIPCDIHCWHFQSSAQSPTCGYDDEICCECGATQRRTFAIEPDRTHGSHISRDRRVKVFDDDGREAAV